MFINIDRYLVFFPVITSKWPDVPISLYIHCLLFRLIWTFYRRKVVTYLISSSNLIELVSGDFTNERNSLRQIHVICSDVSKGVQYVMLEFLMY